MNFLPVSTSSSSSSSTSSSSSHGISYVDVHLTDEQSEEELERMSLIEGKRISFHSWLMEIRTMIPNGVQLETIPVYQSTQHQLELLNKELEDLKRNRQRRRMDVSSSSSQVLPPSSTLGKEEKMKLASQLLAKLAIVDKEKAEKLERERRMLEAERAVRKEQEEEYARCLEEDRRKKEEELQKETQHSKLLSDFQTRLSALELIFSSSSSSPTLTTSSSSSASPSSSSSSTSSVCKLSLRLPSKHCGGKRVQRTFQSHDSLRHVRDFAEYQILKELLPSSSSSSSSSSSLSSMTLEQLQGFKLMSSYPPLKTYEDFEATLEFCGFANTPTLLVVTYN
jgi:hypothetical protein